VARMAALARSLTLIARGAGTQAPVGIHSSNAAPSAMR